MESSVRVSIGSLVRRLGDAGLRLVVGDPDTVLGPAGCVLHDPLAPFEHAPGGILLGVGVDAREQDAEVVDGTVLAAVDAGHAALLVRDLAGGGIAGTPLVRSAERHGLVLLGVEPGVGWLHLEGLVSSVLSTSHDDLERPGTGQDLFDLANATAVLVGGAVTVEDMQQKLLAYSTIEGQPIDDDRRRGILGRQVPVLPENDDQYAAVFASTSAVRIKGVGEALDRLAVAVRAGGQPLGSLWAVDAGGDLGPESARALERAAELAALHMLRLRSAADLARQQRTGLLRRLLGGGPEARLVVDRLGWRPAGPFAVLAMGGPVGEDDRAELRLGRFVDMVEAHCAGLRPAAVAAVVDSTVYVCAAGALAGDRRRLETTAGMLTERGAFLGLEVRAAVGSTVTRPDEVSRSREEADLLLLLPSSETGAVTSVEAARSRLTLLALSRIVRDAPRLASRPARSMRRHDEEHGTAYAETVLAWFEHRMSVGAAAVALSMHPNTLRYRLQRIGSLFEVDLDRPDDLLTLWLGLRLGRFEPPPDPTAGQVRARRSSPRGSGTSTEPAPSKTRTSRRSS